MSKLIRCPLCNQEISPNAVSCPNCGEPIGLHKETKNMGKIDIQPILEVNGEIYENNTYKNAILSICQNYIVVTDLDRTEVYVMLNYDSIKDMDCIHNKPKKTGGVFRDLSVMTFFNKRTHDELPEFKIKNETEVKEFNNKKLRLFMDIRTNPYKYINIKCPSCGSNNVIKISDFSKASSAVFFGIFALSKINNTFECKNCTYRW